MILSFESLMRNTPLRRLPMMSCEAKPMASVSAAAMVASEVRGLPNPTTANARKARTASESFAISFAIVALTPRAFSARFNTGTTMTRPRSSIF
jgi:hypothetical protein